MWPDRVLNPGPLTYESGTLPTALHGPAIDQGLHCLLTGIIIIKYSENENFHQKPQTLKLGNPNNMDGLRPVTGTG